MATTQRTPAEWFQEATRCYLEGHQGCAWCGGSHRVFRTLNAHQVIYFCHGCDFHVSHDAATDRYNLVPGEAPETPSRKTMVEVSPR